MKYLRLQFVESARVWSMTTVPPKPCVGSFGIADETYIMHMLE